MGRNWAWKRMGGGSSARLEESRPDRLFKPDGRSVRYHVPHPTTAAIDRFKKMISIEDRGDDCGECHIFQGSNRFRVSDDRVISPQRFVLESFGEVAETDNCYIRIACGTPNCCRFLHLVWRIKE